MKKYLLLAFLLASKSLLASDLSDEQDEQKAAIARYLEQRSSSADTKDPMLVGHHVNNSNEECSINSEFSSIWNLEKCFTQVNGIFNSIRYNIFFSGTSSYSAGFWKSPPDYVDLNQLNPNQERWSVDCKIDPISDAKFCTITHSKSQIFAYLRSPNSSPSFSLFGSLYPFSNITYRFEKDNAITGVIRNSDGNRFNAAQNQQIHNSLLKGKSGVTRHVNWPYKTNIDLKFDASGYAEAYRFSEAALRRLK